MRLTTIKNRHPLFLILLLFCAFALCGCQRLSAKFIGIQSIQADDLKKAINGKEAPLIIDTREQRSYHNGHIPGAIHLDMDGIDGYLATFKIPRERRIVTVCANGWASQIAAATLMAYGYRDVFSLLGGARRWHELDYPTQSGGGIDTPDKMLKPPVVEISWVSQLAVTAAAFVIKPAYIIMTFLVIVMLWRKTSRDLVLIRDAMVLFFIGENACTLNYLIASNASIWLEFFHGLGMVGMYFLLFWGLVVFFDQRVIHYIEPERACTFQRHCKQCWKKEDVTCGLHRLALYLLPSLAFVALLPVTMPLRPFKIVMPVFLSDVLWLKDFWNLFLEFRLYPLLGAGCFMISFLWLIGGQAGLQKSQRPFFLALGFTSYSFFRFGLLLTFNENQAWADWWEESTEFIMIAMVVLLLTVFKNQLEIETPWPLNKLKPN